jgi:hypothetical protein
MKIAPECAGAKLFLTVGVSRPLLCLSHRTSRARRQNALLIRPKISGYFITHVSLQKSATAQHVTK